MSLLDVRELRTGMVISETIYEPDTNNLLLKQGTKLTDPLIKSLMNRNFKTISISDRYTLLSDPVETIKKDLYALIESEILRLAPDCVEANTSDLMIETSRNARKIAKDILENHDAVKFCVTMKVMDSDYLYQHSLTTCALSLLIAGTLGMEQHEIKAIGTAALLHDTGLCEMPMLLKKNRSEKEEEMWKEHSVYGYHIIKESGIRSDIAELILHHHELWNGTGHPAGLSGHNIPLGSRIIAVCETYDRLIRHEGYKNHQAIEYLYGAGNYYFDSRVVQAFTNSLAVYPLGSMVRLSTGEVGVVVNVRKNQGPRPVVNVFYNRVNRPLSKTKYVDLGKELTVFIEKVL